MLKIFLALALVFMSANAAAFTLNEQFNLLFFGAFGMIVIYNLGYYIFIKDVVYADYFFFHTFVFVIMLFYTGTFDEKFLEFTMNGVPVAWFMLTAILLLAFTRNFLNIKSTHKKIDKYMQYMQYVLVGLYVPSVFSVENFYIIDISIGFIVILSSALLVFSVYLSYVRRDVYTYSYLVAFSGIFISIIISLLSYFNIVASSYQLTYFLEFSLLFEAIVFSFALSYKHKETAVALKQNELLFKELSHRVQNNLQSIISILSLQMSRAKELNVKEYLQGTINRIRTISLIHERLQNSKHVGEVNMQTYLSSLIESYNAFHENVDFKLTCDEDLSLSLEKLTPLALIINELITNSIKHAFLNIPNPRIELKLHNKFELLYEDNGNGYSEAKESLGSLLIQNLSTSQLKGNYTIDSKNKYLFSLRF